ncbi:Protein phosphatase 2C [Cynara cardunculus var. scolymus]|uniref:protein-serine/threonine phosphatase n=1 Tax=Cynara cardunculus var. scolymus TaxID=59895 RepID=A0A103Y702_CYNCS|nr:Protein phosphatase 2C [Cynara cardunculus var. scolymus]
MCTVAISNSPVFSPSSRVSSSIFCKSSPESLTLTHAPSSSSISPSSSFKNHHRRLAAFFGVFDGHGGSKAAEFAAENLEIRIQDEVEKRGEIEIVEAIKQGYLNTDSEFLKQEQRGGACCVTAIIRAGNLVVSNAGDCRAVVSNGGAAQALTSDHRPSRQDEKLRIESLGGYVDSSRGVCRVLGSLAVSRGIGDRSLKQWITSEPETKMFKIVPEFEFLIMASDGLWDKVSNQEAVDIARPFCASAEAVSACKKLVELSASRGSVDDASVMIIQLDRFC